MIKYLFEKREDQARRHNLLYVFHIREGYTSVLLPEPKVFAVYSDNVEDAVKEIPEEYRK